MDGVADDMHMLQRFDELSVSMGEPDADIESLLTEQAALQSQIEDRDLWNLQSTRRDCDASSALPPGEESVVNLSGGEVRRVTVPPADPTT